MKRSNLLLALAAVSLTAQAQQWHEGDIQWINSSEFASNVEKWTTNHQLTGDDNFFVSRVRPKARFQNTATQVRENLKWGENDRRLVAWMPVNTHQGGTDSRDALPTGIFDQEVFTMWSYVDHWGNWTAPLGLVPAGLADVAHKNGVGVSSVASIPFGSISTEWSNALRAITANCNTADKADAFASKAAKMMAYFGVDGVGYNSEFSGFGATQLGYLRNFHEYLLKNLKAEYQKTVPTYDLQENMWYDGTNDNGTISFDNGLGSHNYQTWGPLGQERSSLFFNYNWSRAALLKKSVDNAADAQYGKGRSPLYLYCGLNMQGGEPGASTTPWEVFKDYNLSIGLWGQHKVNMFFEGRGSRGTSPETMQATYQHRIENWFTGGSHNPANVPSKLSNAVTCATEDTEFHGMSTFMSGRSTLSWDLGNEAFVSYFNVGNGKFFNWKGERQNDNEWYNLGAQDFMPTWRWWWTNKFLGKTAEDVPANGLSAAISWNDAYVGGSAIRVTGSTEADEYLHLFKTAYDLKAGDVITFVYKLANGSTEASLVLSVNGAESKIAKEIALCDKEVLSDDSEWHTVKYTVANNDGLAGKTLAMIALKFANAVNADVYLGEVSIKRGTLATPAKPVIERVEILRSHYAGVDGKVFFKMENNKSAGEVCYNDEVKTSYFKIWSREEGKEPVLLGITPSWAAICYSAPFSGDENGNGKIAFGVQAVSLDQNSESEIAWSDNVATGSRLYSDNITIDKSTITPGESFTLSAVDGKRAFAWEIWTAGDNSKKVAESGETVNSWNCEGIDAVGTYDVKCIGDNNTDAGFVLVKNFLVVTDASKGRIPEILTLTANGSETEIEVIEKSDVTLEYTGREANGSASRGIQLEEQFFGVNLKDIMETGWESFSVAGWLKITDLPGQCEWIDIRCHDGVWPRNNWGWLWTNLNTDGTLMDFHHEVSPADAGAITHVLVYDFQNGKKTFFNPGQWTHFAFTFDRDQSKCRTIIYINGEKIESKWFYYTNTGDDFIADPYTTSKTPAQSGANDDYCNAAKIINLKATANPYLSIGGTRHTGRGGGLGFTGVLDDFQVWDHAMTQSEVNASMEGLDGTNLPSGVLAYWDFEEAPLGNNMFPAKGSKAGVYGGYYKLIDNPENEGQSIPSFQIPSFTSGCPFIPGHDYKIETAPEWSVRKTTVTPVEGGNDVSGKAVAKMNLLGDYTATLTLKNDLGSDKKEFQVIKVVTDPASIEGVDANGDLRTYTVDDVLFLEVSEDGNYDVTVYNAAGQQVAAKSQFVSGGSFMRLAFGNAPGVYVVKVLANGNAVKSFKVVKN